MIIYYHPFLEINTINNIIYLEESEFYPVEGILIDENMDLQDALYFADYYQMYNVPTYMGYISTLEFESLPIEVPELLLIESLNNKLAENLIISVLNSENELKWGKESEGELKLGKDSKDEILKLDNLYLSGYMKDIYVENVPTNFQCYIYNRKLCWMYIRNKMDIKRLLYLSLNVTLRDKFFFNNPSKYKNIGLNKITKEKLLNDKLIIYLKNLELATSYSDISCYPYDDDYIKDYNYKSINRINGESLMSSLTFIEKLREI